jgi:hypothetical protein
MIPDTPYLVALVECPRLFAHMYDIHPKPINHILASMLTRRSRFRFRIIIWDIFLLSNYIHCVVHLELWHQNRHPRNGAYIHKIIILGCRWMCGDNSYIVLTLPMPQINVLYNNHPRRTFFFLMAQEDECKNELLQIKDS